MEGFGILKFSLVAVEKGFLDYKDDEAITVWGGRENTLSRFTVTTGENKEHIGNVVSYFGELRYGNSVFDREATSNIYRATMKVEDNPSSILSERMSALATMEVRIK
jgi:hypothetical protein